jgi:aspartate carbamoyltransferase catalytic subunit
MNILSVEQFDQKYLEKLFDLADSLAAKLNDPGETKKLAQKHSDKQLCTLFYEPSTRTRLSFETAALKLGMGVVSTENAGGFSSAAKGETLEDTINVINQYGVSAVVIRHPETGSAQKAAKASKVPIINAGDGKGEHPTQALLDAYTIKKEFGRLDNLHVVAGGDLKNGRTIRSLCRLLSLYPNNRITFVSLPELAMQDDIKKLLRKSGTVFSETDGTNEAFKTADVVYWTRLQKERLEGSDSFKDGGFIIDLPKINILPEHAIVMHPLPRVDEIAPEVDSDPRARYFEQSGNGLYVRMALLDQIASSQK